MDPERKSSHLNRREFISRSLKAGAAVAGACALGYRFYDPIGPAAQPSAGNTVYLPDFSLPSQGKKLCRVRAADRKAALAAAFKGLGGVEQFIKKGDCVLLKVNAAFAAPAMLCATSHPDLVAAMVRLCLKAGAAEVIVTDNPINDPASCFGLSGIGPAARAAGGRVVLPESGLFSPTTLPGGRLIRDWPLLYGPFKNVDKLIGMAPVKDHHRSGASMSLKNWYGLLGGRRNLFHQDIHTIITELALLVKPTLVVLDGIASMMQNGPTGGSLADLKETQTLIVSTDPVAADALGAALLERKIAALPHLEMAQNQGAGTTDAQTLSPIDVNLL